MTQDVKACALERATDYITQLQQLRKLLVIVDEYYDTCNENNFDGIRLLIDIYRSQSDCFLEELTHALQELQDKEQNSCQIVEKILPVKDTPLKTPRERNLRRLVQDVQISDSTATHVENIACFSVV